MVVAKEDTSAGLSKIRRRRLDVAWEDGTWHIFLNQVRSRCSVQPTDTSLLLDHYRPADIVKHSIVRKFLIFDHTSGIVFASKRGAGESEGHRRWSHTEARHVHITRIAVTALGMSK